MSTEVPVYPASTRMQLVLKVKYGDTLRRLTVHVNEDGSPDISLETLRSKIRQLFQLSPSTPIAITYTDEDADVVTMADDVDLMDAVHQGLNPLRLDVSLATTQMRNPPRCAATVEDWNEGLEATLDAFRRATDPTCHLRRLAEIPAVMSALSSPAVSDLMQSIIRAGTANLGLLVEGLSAANPNNSRTPGNSN